MSYDPEDQHRGVSELQWLEDAADDLLLIAGYAWRLIWIGCKLLVCALYKLGK